MTLVVAITPFSSKKTLGIIVVLVVGIAAVGIASYWRVSQEQIQLPENISHTQQCLAQDEALKHRAMASVVKRQFKSFDEWKTAFEPEIRSLGEQCADVLGTEFGPAPIQPIPNL